ncbi:MAG TPA: RluA family pseudouridine synthase [Niabella sp.]|nr:RluA family pseudouridine synthase [Niabella sp.]HOZ96500.1 RluA family pseudouridine synthase [Niabella sp.]HQW13319.1 RluA family pseudouridine synthase [Niabella sp.]HQX18641.1 RluA family pseudouridine synthase [Niabella sp.]HQX40294.1 RluA family pseudouridine synthase [Niabella sp.]
MKIRDLILFENDSLIALNKPSGMLSIPDREASEPSLKDLLQQQYSAIFTVHRLDKETSGLIIFAKTPEAHKHFSKQFEERKTEKIYQGLVIGSVQQKEGSVDAPIAENTVKRGTMIIHKRGKEAITDYQLIKDFGMYSWMQFRIHTGRTHQIRIHSKEIGHPLVCDPIYGDGKPVFLSSFKSKFKLSKEDLEERPLLDRLALHAFQLRIKDETGILLELEAPLYKDLKVTIHQLEKRKSK